MQDVHALSFFHTDFFDSTYSLKAGYHLGRLRGYFSRDPFANAYPMEYIYKDISFEFKHF